METSKDRKGTNFKGFYSLVKRDSDGKIVRETKSFDNIDSYADFIKEKGKDAYEGIEGFFNQGNVDEMFGKLGNLLNKNILHGMDYFTKVPEMLKKIPEVTENLDNFLSKLPRLKSEVDDKEHNNYVENNKKELEKALLEKKELENKQFKEERIKTLTKQKSELEELLKGWTLLNRSDMISQINLKINKIDEEIKSQKKEV